MTTTVTMAVGETSFITDNLAKKIAPAWQVRFFYVKD